MAHKESVQENALKAFLHGSPFFWTVSSSVGYACRNKKEDVLLVQFFLNRIFAAAQAAFDEDPYVDDPVFPKQLVPDGDFGGKTWGAIKWFQKRSKYCVVDGMVSAANGTRLLTPKQGMWYTIYMLNGFYRESFPDKFQDIRSDKELPVLLLSHLSGPLPDLV